MRRPTMEVIANICTIIATVIAVAAVILGIVIVGKVSVSEETISKLEGMLKKNTDTLTNTQKEIEVSRPHYDLSVYFQDWREELGKRGKTKMAIETGKMHELELRIANASGEVTRRADDVSCIVKFPPGFDVSSPRTIRGMDPVVFKQRVPQQNGGIVVGIDYGDDYALHPGTCFIFRVNATPRKAGTYNLEVVADANNPNSPKPAVRRYLTLEVK